MMRLKLLQLYLSITNGKPFENEWKNVQDHINLLEFITP
jgi:hypothetical protein